MLGVVCMSCLTQKLSGADIGAGGPTRQLVRQGVDALFESIFGYERGAFSGAASDSEGYLVAADGGTFDGTVLVLFGDSPFISTATLQALVTRRAQADNPAVVVLGMRPADPAKYGRLILDAAGNLERIVEWKDANAEERAVTLCNSAVMAIDGKALWSLIDRIDNKNANGEYYLTDAVAIVRELGLRVRLMHPPVRQPLGLRRAADVWKRQRRWARLRTERCRRVKRRRKQTADGKGRGNRVGMRDRQGERHDAALREAREHRFAHGGSGGRKRGYHGGNSIGFLRDHRSGDVAAGGVVPDVQAAAGMAIRENEPGAAAITPEYLQQVGGISAHGMQCDDHRHSLVGEGSAGQVFDVAHVGDVALKGARRLSWRRTRGGRFR